MGSPSDLELPARDDRLVLSDGRTIAYTEWGDLAGRPVFFFHGTPGSRLYVPDPAYVTCGVIAHRSKLGGGVVTNALVYFVP